MKPSLKIVKKLQGREGERSSHTPSTSNSCCHYKEVSDIDIMKYGRSIVTQWPRQRKYIYFVLSLPFKPPGIILFLEDMILGDIITDYLKKKLIQVISIYCYHQLYFR